MAGKNHSKQLTGLVLAGGQSRRMGMDKAQILVNGKTLLQQSLDLLEFVCDSVWVSGNPHQTFGAGVLVMTDDRQEGPLMAIVQCLNQLKKPLLVTAVDMPGLTVRELHQLLDQHNPLAGVTAFFDNESRRWEGLVSVWEPAVLEQLENAIGRGERSVHRFLAEFGAKKVIVEDSRAFVNLNRPEDLPEPGAGG